MSDLINRLRETASKGVSVWGDLQMEAAKEIEILTAEREAYASAMDRMTKEVKALQADLKHTEECCVGWATDYGNALKESEALKADAERYRHLRSQFRTEWLHNGVDYGRGREIVSSYARVGVELPRTFARIGHSNSYKVSAETIDKAIDAAIDAARKEK